MIHSLDCRPADFSDLADFADLKMNPEDDRKRVAKVWSQTLKKGETWFIVSRNWFHQFCSYTGFQPNNKEVAGPKLMNSTKPGPVNNSDLCISGNGRAELKFGLSEQDYICVPLEVWTLFVAWFGSTGPVLPRIVVTLGITQVERIDLYPQFLTLYQVDSKSGQFVNERSISVPKYSHFDTLAKFYSPTEGCSGARLWLQHSLDKWFICPDDLARKQIGSLGLPKECGIAFEYRPLKKPWIRRTGKANWKDFAIGDILDVKDQFGIWQEGQIQHIDKECVGIHFPNWSVEWNEIIPLLSVDRFAARNSHTVGPNPLRKTKGKPPVTGAVGLYNLGNTCFMNSILQCLSNTPGLTQYFVDEKYVKEINKDNPLGCKGKIATEYANLIKEIWTKPHSVISPVAIKDAIAELQPRFTGFQQHDSSELLSFLLDGLHEDLNRVQKKPITQPIDSSGRPENLVAIDSWNRHLLRNQSIIVDTMQGQLRSRVVCPTCTRESITFDPFMFLSVPFPTESNEKTHKIIFVPWGGRAKVYRIKGSKFDKVRDVKESLMKIVSTTDPRHPSLNVNNFMVAEVSSARIIELFSDDHQVSKFGIKDKIVVYEVPSIPPAPSSASASASSAAPAASAASAAAEPGSKTETKDVKEHQIKVQLGFFAIVEKDKNDKRLHPVFSSTIIALPTDQLTHFSNAELYSICRSTLQSFVKKDEANIGTIPPFQLFVADQHCLHCVSPAISNDHGITNLLKEGPFSIGVKINVNYLLPPEDEGGAAADAKEEENLINAQKLKLNIYNCIDAFTKEEILSKSESWYCNKCKQHLCASKKLDLWKLPDVLIIHLKRFIHNENYRDKNGSFVDFPLETLDLQKWVINSEEKNAVYNLYAVSNHFGGLGGGHYTAYARNVTDKRWYNLDDSHVMPLTDTNAVKTPAAYVLFYVRSGVSPGSIPNVPPAKLVAEAQAALEAMMAAKEAAAKAKAAETKAKAEPPKPKPEEPAKPNPGDDGNMTPADAAQYALAQAQASALGQSGSDQAQAAAAQGQASAASAASASSALFLSHLDHRFPVPSAPERQLGEPGDTVMTDVTEHMQTVPERGDLYDDCDTPFM